jgi:hypothetical protein
VGGRVRSSVGQVVKIREQVSCGGHHHSRLNPGGGWVDFAHVALWSFWLKRTVCPARPGCNPQSSLGVGPAREVPGVVLRHEVRHEGGGPLGCGTRTTRQRGKMSVLILGGREGPLFSRPGCGCRFCCEPSQWRPEGAQTGQNRAKIECNTSVAILAQAGLSACAPCAALVFVDAVMS